MNAPRVGLLGLVLLGLAAWPAEAQGLRVVIGVNAPPVSARVVLGDRGYDHAYRPAGVWATDPYLARLHYRHVRWMAHQEAHLAAMRHDHRYWKAVRAYERERSKRERELDRAYHKWLRHQDRAYRKGHRH